MAKKRTIHHSKKTTLIIVGEGLHEKAFLTHMKNLYDQRDSRQTVKIDTGNGGSPHDIIKNTIKKTSHLAFDRKYILMDSDVAIAQKDLAEAFKKGIVVLLSEPICLEGMLLDILGERIPTTASQCKSLLHPKLDGKPTEAKSYVVIFPKPILDKSTKITIEQLRAILANFKI